MEKYLTVGRSESRQRIQKTEIEQLSEAKKHKILQDDGRDWSERIKKELQEEIDRRVREALETPPMERMRRRRRSKNSRKEDYINRLKELNNRVLRDLTFNEKNLITCKDWKKYQRRRIQMMLLESGVAKERPRTQPVASPDFALAELHTTTPTQMCNDEEISGSQVLKFESSPSEDNKSLTESRIADYAHTKNGFLEALDEGELIEIETGVYRDYYAVTRTTEGPFSCEPIPMLFPCPQFRMHSEPKLEPLLTPYSDLNQARQRIIAGSNAEHFRSGFIVFDREKTSKDQGAHPVPNGCLPSLIFESRFECGNLRQARRIGPVHYELVLSTDYKTAHHTQWYFFEIRNALPDIEYKFTIVNFLKKDSLYNQGMQPLIYSTLEAQRKRNGWYRTGTDIIYTRNCEHNQITSLFKTRTYYALHWKMTFPHANDTCYLAHCYPYSFTMLQHELKLLEQTASECVRKDALCTTRAGNTCYLLTITDFSRKDKSKRTIVVTARVHAGESGASWMCRGLINFLVSSQDAAVELRKKFVFKIVPMLNPDGVIIGNYRCSLTARDLNRNYRKPRQMSFPTVWHLKKKLMETHNPVFYCDMHGHSRKLNVFMYGCSSVYDETGDVGAENFLNERFFPWLLSEKAKNKFSFNHCRFHIRKCKESTGRVVMFRQYQLMNSFTLEASFAGSSISNQKFHFNTLHYEEMGKQFGETLWKYYHIQDNKDTHASTLVDLTTSMVKEISEQRDMNVHSAIQIFYSTQPLPQPKSKIFQQGMQSVKNTVLRTLQNMLSKEQELEHDRLLAKQELSGSRLSFSVQETQKHHQYQATQRLINVVSDAFENGFQTEEEPVAMEYRFKSSTSSSDSDSESEAEEKIRLAKARSRKKRIKTKKHIYDLAITGRKADTAGLHVGQALPLLSQKSNGLKKAHTTISASSLQKTRLRVANYPRFVSRFEGRSNDGIPCFTEERSVERMTKRIDQMQNNIQAQRRKELKEYMNSPLLPVEMKQKLYDMLAEYDHEEEQDSATFNQETQTENDNIPLKLEYRHGDQEERQHFTEEFKNEKRHHEANGIQTQQLFTLDGHAPNPTGKPMKGKTLILPPTYRLVVDTRENSFLEPSQRPSLPNLMKAANGYHFESLKKTE